MSKLDIIATFPFMLHVLTSFGAIYRSTDMDAPVDSLLYWKNTFIDCYRLGPVSGPYCYLGAFIQGLLPIIALLFHWSPKLQTRKVGYLILAAMYFTTQLRLVIFGAGLEVISYLYMHIVVFSVLVLFNDNTPRKDLQS